MVDLIFFQFCPLSNANASTLLLRVIVKRHVTLNEWKNLYFQEVCYSRSESAGPDCVTLDTDKKHSGGTWPKMVVGVTMTTESPAQLSIYKSPKQRKSIFDTDTFKRPDTPSKMEYLTGHSPQPSKTEGSAAPPTPPTRCDSFKFKPKQQSGSASDSTITEPKREDRNGNLYFTEGKTLSSRKSCEEDIGRVRVEEPEVKRPRPKSAPALRRRMTPQSIPLQSFQVRASELAVLAIPCKPLYLVFSYVVCLFFFKDNSMHHDISYNLFITQTTGGFQVKQLSKHLPIRCL